MANNINDIPEEKKAPKERIYRFHPDELVKWARGKLEEGNDNGQKQVSEDRG